jgi:hypothetical protein
MVTSQHKTKRASPINYRFLLGFPRGVAQKDELSATFSISTRPGAATKQNEVFSKGFM